MILGFCCVVTLCSAADPTTKTTSTPILTNTEKLYIVLLGALFTVVLILLIFIIVWIVNWLCASRFYKRFLHQYHPTHDNRDSDDSYYDDEEYYYDDEDDNRYSDDREVLLMKRNNNKNPPARKSVTILENGKKADKTKKNWIAITELERA